MPRTLITSPKFAKALSDLRGLRLEWAAWEFWLLLVLMVTVFGIAAQGPVTDFPAFISTFEPYHQQQIEQDPYDVHQEFSYGDVRNNVETGL